MFDWLNFDSVEGLVIVVLGALGGVLVSFVSSMWKKFKAKAAESENKIDDKVVELAEETAKKSLEP